ncbi:DUF4492 domain-containing protein [Dysgonamonadaceae bacterium]|jgi:hypothetical protein|nr:DUF4492 domain-containing protein [Dysgonamonadaceae bacterium]
MKTELQTSKFNWFAMFWDGFTHMTWLGKTLWIVVILKLIFMFGIIKPIFSPNYLDSKFNTEDEKASYVTDQLLNRHQITE